MSRENVRDLAVAVAVAVVGLQIANAMWRASPTRVSSPPVFADVDRTEAVQVPPRERLKSFSPKRQGLVLLEFSDFQCPFCGRFARETGEALRRRYSASKTIDFVFLNQPLTAIHPYAKRAAEAAECAQTDEQYWAVHDRLFAHQDRLTEADLRAHTADAGLGPEVWNACMGGEASRIVDADIALAKSLGINGTPTFFLASWNGDGSVRLLKRLDGAGETAAFEGALEAALQSVSADLKE